MTRTIALALAAAATLGTATVASADSYFGIIDRQGDSAILDLGTVVSEADGVVEIYNGDTLLGSSAVRAGANGNVRVNVNTPPLTDVTAQLRSGDAVLAERQIDISRN
ncbi:hypothetical protein [Roseisalinus antarcticus]|uniref:DUF5666 domain-containing protein n=1 Tax=Roseisalinus antarcticus TaxID=254357 RepID=A0A1Y5RRR7_9RHOB|nr:hypothetical protein [Roseisalinus antarcticus]SLN23877.1 hypothetical protein ROA7023_00724 [Roseisalinus antarcticus]